MTEIAASNSIFSNYAISNKTEEKSDNGELGQTAFLELMITQLENQDPLSPQDNSAFVAQLAQFSSVESLYRLNNNFDSFTKSYMANQALQASSLVGRSVTVPASQTRLDLGGVVNASVDLPQTVAKVDIDIYSEDGALVDQIHLGPQSSGEMIFRWDGMNAEVNGEILDWRSSQENGAPAGNYRFDVSTEIDGKETALTTALSANVNSVTIGADGQLTLNLAGIGAVSMADVKQFND